MHNGIRHPITAYGPTIPIKSQLCFDLGVALRDIGGIGVTLD